MAAEAVDDESKEEGTSGVVTIPRVNFALMKRHIGTKVSIVGRVLRLVRSNEQEGVVQYFRSPDEQIYDVHIADPNWQGYNTQFIEVIGVVKEDGQSIEQIDFEEWGDNFNLKTWNKFILMANQYPNLF